ncbi:kelch-like protein 41b [Cloeon dipterum]|uniref:kelch-like protein 41b n=1 Tax=Cloeon dipterum TaxID=197152 RepID=UPI00321F9DE7
MLASLAGIFDRKSKKRRKIGKKEKDEEKSQTMQPIRRPPMPPSSGCRKDSKQALTLPAFSKKRGKAPVPTPRPLAASANLTDKAASEDAPECDNWRTKSTRCKDNEILQLYLTGQLTDCSFSVGKPGEDQVTFKCHRIILSSTSKSFEKLFFSDEQKALPETISINASPVSFDLVMKYIYGNKILFPNPVTCVEMCKMAHSWRLPHLAAAAENYLISKAGIEHYLIAFEMFSEQGKLSEKLRFLNLIKRNASSVLKTQYWLLASDETVREVLSYCRYLLLAQEKFDALLAWGTAQVKRDEKICAEDELIKQVREKICPFLSLIDFDLLSPREFASRFCKETVLTAEEKLDMLVRIVLK